MSLTGKNNEEKIWNYLYAKLGNTYGAAGLMGNLYAESALRPENLQDTFNTKLNMTDEMYTLRTDNGDYSNFIRDSAGYGLAQWTFWTRKQGLLEYARKSNKSVGDLEVQLEYLFKELETSFPTVLSFLKTAKTVKEASNKVLLEFEAPSMKLSEATQTLRTGYSQTYFDRYANGQKEEAKAEASTIYELAQKSKYAKYILSTGTKYISNSGGDERGRAVGGAAGDQTGNEWVMKSWYNRPWDCILRYPDIKVGIKIAELGCAAAENNHIGYDQNERYTYWNCLQKAGYDPSKITTNCEADCSAGVIANVKAVGFLLNNYKLKDIKATYTGDMKQSFVNAGFQVLTSSQYLASPDYLLPGDILLNEVHHTATMVTLGTKVRTGSVPNSTPSATDAANTLSYGASGSAVKTMQEMLIKCGYNCGKWGADGDFGSATLAALRKFQTNNKILVDGVYGPKTKEALEAAYAAAQKAEEKPSAFKSFRVKVTANSLNVRAQPNTSSKIMGVITDKGVYTIIDTQGSWGKLKSGMGWISLNYAKKI